MFFFLRQIKFACAFCVLNCSTNDRLSRLPLVAGFCPNTTRNATFQVNFSHVGQKSIDLNVRTMKRKEVGKISTQLNLPLLSSEVQILTR